MASAFKDFEHEAWENAVDQYDAAFSRLTKQVIPTILDVIGVHSGMSVLDIACGPGNLAVAAKARGGKPVGLDFSALMVVRARKLHPDIVFQEGDAESLSGFADSSFDAIAMNFGILHLDRPDKALEAACRVLKPGGRFAFTAWGMQKTVAGFDIPLKAIQAHGDPSVQLPPGPPFFFFSDPANCRDAFLRCGFCDPHSMVVDQSWEFDTPEAFFDALLRGTARTGGTLKRQPPERLAAIRGDVCEAARSFVANGKVVLPMPAHLAWAQKPSR